MINENLTAKEFERYNRHLVLEGFGAEGQLKLKNAKVLVIGAGGLGCPALLYLTAAGIGSIGIVDFDSVDFSNLQRQVLFRESDVGKNKAEVAKQHLKELNHDIIIKSYPVKLSSSNVFEILNHYDVVLDGTDNFSSRYLINDACVLLNKPFVYGSILQFEGQLAVFNLKEEKGFTANYRDIFAEPPYPSTVPDCSEAGVLGVLPGIIGTMQANEAIKIITGLGKPLVNKLLIFDALSLQQNIITIKNKNAREGIKSLIDYEEFCGISQQKNKSLELNQSSMKEITVQELKALKDSGADFQLIDVREPYEYEICNIGGELIPQSEVPHNLDKISKDKKVILHCRGGGRSGRMIEWLEKNHQFTNLYNLKGGVTAWANEIDPDMPTY